MKIKKLLIIESRALLAVARIHRIAASRKRKAIGGNPGLNPYPISGGICENWTKEEKESVLRSVYASQDAQIESLALWKAAGKRVNTWRREALAERV
jgi:hypothetical protein